ncbi:MAG: 4-hydroxy-3-methylbut-2-enyl diphosphate reductase [Bacteroidota bacterium]
MPRTFNVPEFYRSPVVGRVKAARQAADPRKQDLSPSVLDFGPVQVKMARHFGFCFGVENAIETAYRALDEHPDKAEAGQIYLLSEMIHNPHVNEDLLARGFRFLRTTKGETIIPFDTLGEGDLVIVPAFGAPTDVIEELAAQGVDVKSYDTTCPFVVRVWKKGAQIGGKGYSIVIHGKWAHEETQATFSRAAASSPAVVVLNPEETEALAAVIDGREDAAFFWTHFEGRTSEGFDPDRDLHRVGVVNQTTMLATETAAIAERVRQAIVARDGSDEAFADTSDTLCYATKENQDATEALIASGADVAIVVGGYNSSNTSHLVELCEDAGLPTYFVTDADQMVSPSLIHHFDWRTKTHQQSADWLPTELDRPVDVLLNAGASCPDALLDAVIRKLLGWFPDTRPIEEAVAPFEVAPEPASEAPRKKPTKRPPGAAKPGKPPSRPPGAARPAPVPDARPTLPPGKAARPTGVPGTPARPKGLPARPKGIPAKSAPPTAPAGGPPKANAVPAGVKAAGVKATLPGPSSGT